MPLRQFHCLFVLSSLLALLLSACGSQMTIPLPQITQESLPINSSVEVATFTSAPTGLWIGDSVPVSLREQAKSWDIPRNVSLRLEISPSELNQGETKI